MGVLFAVASGWTAVLFYVAAVVIPLIARAAAAARFPGFWIHYVVGLLTPVVGLVHAWVLMSAGRMSAFNLDGLWIATAALFLAMFQAGLGLALRSATVQTRARLRSIHFATMLLLGALLVVHVWLNRA